MRKSLFASALLALAFTTSASAAEVIWTLDGATFTDGGIATGSFTYDASLNTISSFSVSVSGGDTATFPAFTWDPGTAIVSTLSLPSNNFINFIAVGSLRQLRVSPLSPFTDAGGTIGFDLSNSFAADCFNCAPFRRFASGSFVGRPVGAPAVPEPATWAMMLLGFFGIGAAMRRQRPAVVNTAVSYA